ncbi:MAG: hypothetical protein Q4F95_05630 [Oscillospiraceae bacterium]|nr:hypothetical protein [Oscillospiraceae bacterium]
MAVSYRLKKRELIFLLDRLGDINSLYQGFGFMYLDSEDCMNAAKGLADKGVLTIAGENIYLDRGFRYIIQLVFCASCVACDEEISLWIYWNDGVSLLIEPDSLSEGDYIITPLSCADDLELKLSDDYPDSRFIIFASEKIRTDLPGLIGYLNKGMNKNE